MQIPDREAFDKLFRNVSTPESPPEGLGKGRSTETRGSNRSGKSGKSPKSAKSGSRPFSRDKKEESESPRSSAGGEKEAAQKARLDPVVRKRAEITAKWEKTEAIRAKDKKDIAERISKRQNWRDDRFKRLMDTSWFMGAEVDMNYRTAMDMQLHASHQENRRAQLHAAREAKLFQPIADQVHNYMNPPNRRLQQILNGTKSVSFHLPDETFQLKANVHGDPAWRPMADHAKENAFHEHASKLLGQSQSAPSLRAGPPSSAPAAIGRPGPEDNGPLERKALIPRSRSRQVLDPGNWSQVRLQGTMYGKLAQVAEESEGNHAFRRMRRGGADAHLPDEGDGIAAAGTRKHRVFGSHHKGILTGDSGYKGESGTWKTDVGSSSAAPLQDHFTFEMGRAVTDVEFPLGKKMWPVFP
jgi:hypothetical protein